MGTPDLSSGGVVQAKDRRSPVRSAEQREAVDAVREHRHVLEDRSTSANDKRAPEFR